MIPDRSSEWQYLSDGVVSDPVPEERLRELVAKGVIPGNAPVRAGDAGEWQPYAWVFEDAVEAEAVPDPEVGYVTCAYSGKRAPESEMLPFGEQWVAPEHREAFVQQLREGAAEPGTIEGYPFACDFSLESVFRQSVAIWTANWLPLAAFALILWAPFTFLIEYLAYDGEGADVTRQSRLYQLFGFFLGSLVSAGGLAMTKLRWHGEGPLTTGALFREGSHHYGKVLATRFISYLLLIPIGLLIVFVVVGSGSPTVLALVGVVGGGALVYFGIRLSSAEAFAVLVDGRPGEGFALSWQKTRKRFWRCFLYRAVCYVPVLLGVMLVSSATLIPFLDHFVGSALASLVAEAIMTFSVVFEMVLAIHLQNAPDASEPS